MKGVCCGQADTTWILINKYSDPASLRGLGLRAMHAGSRHKSIMSSQAHADMWTVQKSCAQSYLLTKVPAACLQADATNPPIMLPRQRRRMQQLATAQGGPGAENGAQAAPGKPVGSMLGRRRGLEKQGSAVPGPSQRLKPGQDVEPLHAS